MPINVKRDLKRKYNFGKSFSLKKSIPQFQSGSLLNRVKEDIADQNWDEFYKSWNFVFPLEIQKTKRNIMKSIASKFNLSSWEEPIFDELWTIASDAEQYSKDQKETIQSDINKAYKYVASIASGDKVNKITFDRVKEINSNKSAKYVIFSDLHMTNFKRKPNYFKMYNYDLYLEVLKHYADLDYHLIENGDVEECLIYEPTLADAELRRKQAPGKGKFPITLNDDKWAGFLTTRYKQRMVTLNNVIGEFQTYYNLIREAFIAKGKYTRLTGNHDTYLNEKHERDLKNRIEQELGMEVYDILRISQSHEIKYLVLHGHQFDTACIQHGSIPFAKSLGEVFSECLSWAFQGPDRAWTIQDTKKWYIGNIYNNILAVEEPGQYHNNSGGELDLVLGNADRIKSDSKDFVETLLGYEVAWEYFENKKGYEALTLEMWTGEELYKTRHMNEVNLCTKYAAEYRKLKSGTIPKIVLGHTHEPRQNAVFPDNCEHDAGYYLNSGSAGRYENLIWGVEIEGDKDKIVSWSKEGGKLKKITWKSSGDKLVHDKVIFKII